MPASNRLAAEILGTSAPAMARANASASCSANGAATSAEYRPPSARDATLVVEKVAVLASVRARIPRHPAGDRHGFGDHPLSIALAPFALQPVADRVGHRLGHAFASEARQLRRQSVRLGALDVRLMRAQLIGRSYRYRPTQRPPHGASSDVRVIGSAYAALLRSRIAAAERARAAISARRRHKAGVPAGHPHRKG
jgi:hypothetical protein